MVRGLDHSGAIHARRLFDLQRHRIEVRFQQPGHEGQQDGAVNDDQCGLAIEQAKFAEHHVERQDQRNGRHHVGDENTIEQAHTAGES